MHTPMFVFPFLVQSYKSVYPKLFFSFFHPFCYHYLSIIHAQVLNANI